MFTKKEKWGLEAATSMAIVAAVLYCSWPLGFVLDPRVNHNGLASELGAYGQPYNWVFIGGDIVSGGLLLIACLLLTRLFRADGWRKFGLVMLAVYAVCGALDAALPLRCLPTLQTCEPLRHDPMLIVHGFVDILGSVALIATLVAEWFYAWKYHRRWLTWIYIIGGGGLLFAALSLWFILTHGPGYWAQRYYITLSCIWVASLPIVFRSQAKRGSTNMAFTQWLRQLFAEALHAVKFR